MSVVAGTPSGMNETPRWNVWLGRARLCCRATTAIDSAVAVTREAPVEAPAEVLQALRAAEAALREAREAVQQALAARALRPENREPVYGLAA